MPTVSASLALSDAFSQRLSQINSALTATIELMERLEAQMRMSMMLHINTVNAVSNLEMIKQQITALGSKREIQISVNSGEVLQQIRTIKQQLGGELAGSIIEVRIQASDVAAEANRIRQQIETISTTSAIQLLINSGDVTNQLGRIRQQIQALSSTEVRISLNDADVLAQLSRLQQRVTNLTTAAILRIQLNAGDISAQAADIRRRINSELNHIVARIRIELPQSLHTMFANLQRLVLQLIRVTRQLRTRSGDAQQLRQALARIATLERQIADLQGRVNNRIREAGKGSAGWLSSLKSIAATYLSIAGAKSLFESTVGGAMEQLQMKDMFKARTGNDEVGAAMFDKFKKEALAAGQDVTKSLQSTLSFFSTTQNTDQLTKLNNFAQRLNAFDSAGNGIEGAAFALKEAMSGDIVSLAERFNMSKSDIRALKIDELGKSGDMDGFIKAFDQLLERQKMGQAAFDKMMASPTKQLETLGNNLRSTLADAGGAAVQSLTPLITRLNTAFQAGTFEPFFDALSSGLDWVVQKGMDLLDTITSIYSYFTTNWASIEPIIYGLVTAFAVWELGTLAVAAAQGIAALATGTSTAAIFLQTLATSGLAAAWGTLNTAMKANIIILVVSLIIGLIIWLVKLWQTNDQFAAGLMRVWNTILNFFDQVPIFFVKVGYGIADAFDTAKVESLKILEDLANGAVDRINSLIEKLKEIPGVSLDLIDHVEFTASAAAEAEAARQSRAAKIAAMQADAANKAAEREAKVQKMLDDRESKREQEAAEKAAKEAEKKKKEEDQSKGYDFSDWNKKADADRAAALAAAAADDKKDKDKKLKAVGEIEKPVDISKEDLKILRDIAEIKNIQNFVTLTPTVQVKTGPVTNSANVDSIVKKITTKLNEDIAASAKGVYS
ncbi:hypothetical protein KIH86_17630 [Paenibacillus sp. HN-1]|uniref:hypothetical protein n=1 Tax=Paenibacillus TaxID=44249 RepID=UPI001CA84144|nr:MULTISPECIES: hypothetical protein [Paenibacillus]MBY9078310.1 hypothetical protein [Paenibacillus sp. CGMCC 1.18879]MBY9086031.1 hypothetical protein [Paenibacillus sinensis]